MHHSESEQAALCSSIEFVPKDDEFQKSLVVSLEQGSTPQPTQSESNLSRRRITILKQGNEYANVFDQAQVVILGMRDSYEQMFKNWKKECDINSELSAEIKNLKLIIESQKIMTKKILGEKSQIQEELARSERRPKIQDRMEDLECEVKSLKIEKSQLKTENSEMEKSLNEKTQTLQFYRDEFGRKDEGSGLEGTSYRKRTVPIKRFNSTPTVNQVTEKRGCKVQAPTTRGVLKFLVGERL
ncbi:hypothetical protein LOD99_16005 [Oopsacas minuta]|uniref:Uncharacterized protein n=1 Tax=Oopsacas minuta TaxID=111878 RepID=A0AAV7K6R4_9METZ|nr:hypothetical protein LOD99_16005 [Oopsacas minuta]